MTTQGPQCHVSFRCRPLIQFPVFLALTFSLLVGPQIACSPRPVYYYPFIPFRRFLVTLQLTFQSSILTIYTIFSILQTQILRSLVYRAFSYYPQSL